MKRFINSLSFKIGAVIILVEIAILITTGIYYIKRFSNQVDQRMVEKAQLPGLLINTGYLNLDAVADEDTMRDIVGEELVVGMIIGVNGNIFYSLNPQDLGENVREYANIEAALSATDDMQTSVFRTAKTLTVISPIYAADRATPRFFSYIEIDTSQSEIEKINLRNVFIINSVITILATSAIIIFSFERLIAHRARRIVNVLRLAESGDLSARLENAISKDEIGIIQRNTNAMISARQEAEQTILHLNRVLRAIRNVNQLIVRETNRDRIIEGICNLLTETRGFQTAWIILWDEDNGLEAVASAGQGLDFSCLIAQLERGQLPDCGKQSLAQSDDVVIKDTTVDCVDCPLATSFIGQIAMTVRLEYRLKIYGLLAVSIPAQFTADAEEQNLLQEIAGDIAFALHNIELETQRKQIEVALRDSEERLRQIVQNMPVLLDAFDENFNIIAWNRECEEVTGYAAAEMIGAPLPLETLYPDTAYREKMEAQALDMGLHFRDQEWTLTCKDGTQKTISWSNISSDFPVPGWYTWAIGMDVTERVRAEQSLKHYADHLEDRVQERTHALEQAQAHLLHQERLATLGQIAGSIAHELRTPLGAIKNAAYLLNMLLDASDTTVQETLNIINLEVDTSAHIIDSLLNFAHPQQPVRQITDIPTVIERTLFRVVVPDQIRIDMNLDDSLPSIFADANQLEEVIAHLLRNAVQAMPDGGKIALRAHHPEPTWLVVEVTDTGRGIEPANIPQVFQPLFTTKATGIGLGLAYSRNIIEAHGGHIEVKSTPGEGSAFTIWLPVSTQIDADLA